MERNVRLGRLAGIEIGVSWTWFIVLALVVWTLAAGVFPDQNPGLATGTYWLMAAIAALLFFASVLLHEMGHALQARRDDVEIEGITLWLLGGVARFRGMYRTPGAELRIALAGPAVTAVIAAVLLGVAATVALPTAAAGVVFWLGYINLIVLVFNLFPALPLDGGRVLHAGLWRAWRDLTRATRAAAAVGQGFGWLLIGGGVALFFTGAGVGGIWLVVLGWFLSIAARAEAQHMAAREALRDLRVRDLMTADPVTVSPDLTLGDFMDDIARKSKFTSYPVVGDGGQALGLLTFRCVAEVPRAEWDRQSVTNCMLRSGEVPTLGPEEGGEAVLERLQSNGVNRILVVEDEHVVGIVSPNDVTRLLEVKSLSASDRRGESGEHRRREAPG